MAKLTMAQLSRKKTYIPGKTRKGEAPSEDNIKKLGRVHQLVFAHDSKTVVGFMIKRPDIAGMVKQDDRFVPLDAVEFRENGIVCRGNKDDFDNAAAKRLGINLDTCIIWEGCDVKTQSGKYLGYVIDACFDSESGVVDYYAAQEGSTASAIVGNFEIPAAWLIAYKDGTMIVRDEAANLELSGGLAGKAGEGYAVAKDKAKEGVAKADEVASKAVDKGSHALGGFIGRAKQEASKIGASFQEGMGEGSEAAGGGSSAASAGTASTAKTQGVENKPTNGDNVQKAAQAVGSQLKKSKGMFSDFMREFKDASK